MSKASELTLQKFTPTGEAVRHRGTTFVSFLVPGSPLARVGERILAAARTAGLAGTAYALLPLASLHMTVFESLKDRPLSSQPWPSWLDGVADLETATALMRERLVAARIAAPRGVVMRPTGMVPFSEALTIALEPADASVAAELDRFRREAGAALEIPVPPLSAYRFHSSLGYVLPTAAQQDAGLLASCEAEWTGWVREVSQADLAPVAFCGFHDMLAFVPLLRFA